jgi:transmembrane protein
VADVVPSFVHIILRARASGLFARALLTSPFWTSGLLKLIDLQGTTSEVAHFGLPFPAAVASLTIIVQLLGSALVIHGRQWTWLGAGALGVFTFWATMLAHMFWTAPEPERLRQAATFFEHLGLIGGLILAAMIPERTKT